MAFPYFRNAYFRAVVLGIAPLSALIGFTLGTIVGGLATPTEAASCGAFGAALLALIYGRLDMKSATNAAIGTMVTSAMVLFLAVASNVFGAVFTKLGTANLITNYAPRRSSGRLVEAGADHVHLFRAGMAVRVAGDHPGLSADRSAGDRKAPARPRASSTC